jgi:PII-like signaling protein
MNKTATQRLRIYVGETDQHEGGALYKWLIAEAHQHGLAGATAIRAMEGFGQDGDLHTAKVFRLSTDLPVIVEIIDSSEKVSSYLDLIRPILPSVLATTEAVTAVGRGA